jgi:hypothetical protein
LCESEIRKTIRRRRGVEGRLRGHGEINRKKGRDKVGERERTEDKKMKNIFLCHLHDASMLKKIHYTKMVSC